MNITSPRILSIVLLFTLICVTTAQAQTWQLSSPNGRVQIDVERNGEGLPRYRVSYDGNPVISPSALGILQTASFAKEDARTFTGPEIIQRSVDEVYHVVLGKTRMAPDRYNEMTLRFTATDKGHDIELVFRAYDNGAAFRYILPPRPEIAQYSIYGERTQFSFPADYACWGSNMGHFHTSHEAEFDPVMASKIRIFNNYDSPLVCKTGVGETTFALAEADVEHYPGAYYARLRNNALGVSVRLAPTMGAVPSNSYTVVKITQTDTPLRTPWRVIMLGDSPRALVESSLISTLGAPSRISDTSWIRGGKAIWEWWNNWNAPVENPGRNTDTYLAYIDFAADMGLEYVLMDAGWYQGANWSFSEDYERTGSDVTQSIQEIDMPRILAHAKARKIGIFVWVQWKQLDRQMDEAFATYARWGLAGVKPDFMDRNDQEMVNWYHKVLSKAAEHRLMVNLHGAYPPNGLERTYPNLVNQEAVLEAEFAKFNTRITARHNVTIPYTRMILGPIDYSPGGFIHSTPEDFMIRYDRPMVQTTRGQAVAMYVVHDAPMVTVSDAPQAYRNADGTWADGAEFIAEVPTTWDETRVLQGDIGEYIVTARRKGDLWYLGAMTNEDGRMLDLALDFLDEGAYEAKVWQDGKDISSLEMSTRRVDRSTHLPLKLAATGGGVAIFRPVAR